MGMNDNSAHSARLIVDRQSPALKEALWGLVGDAKGDGGVLAPVTVVGPSQYANLSLRQELGRNGFVNVRFLVLGMLAESLGAAAMARDNRRPLTPVLENVLIREILENAQGPLAAVSEHRATHASVRASFRELRRVSESVRQGLEKSGGVRSEVVRLYRSFRQRTDKGWYDPEDLANAAADAVREGRAPALADLGLVVFYLPQKLSPGETRLLEVLSRQSSCAVILGTTGDELADGPVQQLSESLRPLFGEPQRAFLNIDQEPLLTGDAKIHIATDAHEELRQVIREIMANAEAGMPLHRMAVLYRMDPPYGSMVREELDLAGIQMAGPGQTSLGDTAVGRTLTGLLRLASRLGSENALRRDDVMGWLTGCPVRRPRDMDSVDFSPARWDAISRRAGVIRGIGQWQRRLTAYADWLDEGAGADVEDLTTGQLERMASDASVARAALRFVEQLALDVRPNPSLTKWEDFCSWAQGLMRRYLRRKVARVAPDSDKETRRVIAEEREARDKILRVLEELQTADRFERGTSLAEFRQAVEEALEAPVRHLGATGQGVFVSNFATAAGMDFDEVWLVGMMEGAAPPRLHDDPLLPEALWKDAGGVSRFADRIAKERYDYVSAATSTDRRSLSYPVADPASRRKSFPSRWLLEQAGELAGQSVFADDLPRLQDKPWLSVTPSLENSIAVLETPGDSHDYNLHRLLRWTRQDQDLSAHPLAQQGALARGVRLSRGRGSHGFTEFDGNLSGIFGAGKAETDSLQTVVSATSLERWAVCPFRYFLANVLRLSALEDPEEATTISPLDSGLLVHKILESFISASQNARELPSAGEQWRPEQRLRLMDQAESMFAQYESRGLTGKPLLWEMKKLEIQADLDKFLIEDAKLRERFGTAEVLVETRFGPGKAWPEVMDEETGIPFRGIIDRVDLKSDGSPAVIIDYKTGNANSFRGLDSDPIDSGRHLQLGVYSLAARHISGMDGAPAVYWFVSSGGGFRFAPASPLDVSTPDVMERFRRGVYTISEGIRSGVFPANPGSGTDQDGNPSNCSYCDFNSLCPSRRVQLWERKKSDGFLGGYLALSESDVAQQQEEG